MSQDEDSCSLTQSMSLTGKWAEEMKQQIGTFLKAAPPYHCHKPQVRVFTMRKLTIWKKGIEKKVFIDFGSAAKARVAIEHFYLWLVYPGAFSTGATNQLTVSESSNLLSHLLFTDLVSHGFIKDTVAQGVQVKQKPLFPD